MNPTAPINVAVPLGLGFANETVTPLDSDGLRYSVGYHRIVSSVEDENNVMASLSNSTGSSSLPSKPSSPPFTVDCALSKNIVWPDDPVIRVAAQARDSSFNTFANVTITILHNTTTLGSCTSTNASGVCVASVNVSDLFTTEEREVSLEIGVADNETCQQSLSLMSRDDQYKMDDVFMVLPQRPVTRDENVPIRVYSTFNRRLLTFSFICEVSGSAVITDSNSPITWGRISNFFDNSQTKISITGFRNYDKANASETDFAQEELFTLTISDINSSTVAVQCRAVKLQLTNLETLPPRNLSLGELILKNDTGMIHLFPYTMENEVANVAPLLSTVSNFPIYTLMLNEQGDLQDVSSSVNCTSENPQVVRVTSNCSSFFFNGSETLGSNDTSIILGHLGKTARLQLRVWLVSTDIDISVEDETLNAIETCSNCKGNIYQRTRFSILTTISDSISELTISVTSLLASNVTVENTSVVTISESGYVQGEGAGNTSIRVDGYNKEAAIIITVSEDQSVVPAHLDLFTYSDISVTVDSREIIIELERDFQYVNSALYVAAVVQFCDGHVLLLDKEDGLTFFFLDDTSNSTITQSPYTLSDPVDQFSVSVEWQSAARLGDNCIGLSFNDTNTSLLSVETPELQVTSSSLSLTSADDMVSLFSIPTEVYIEAMLVYYNSRTVNVTDDQRTNFSLTPSGLTRNASTSAVTVTGNMSGIANVSVQFMYRGEPLNDFITIDLVSTQRFYLRAHPVDGPMSMEVTVIGLIGDSGKYQQVVIKAYLEYSNNSVMDITDRVTISLLTDNATLAANNVLTVSGNLSSIEVQANYSHFPSEVLELPINSSSIRVKTIESITLTPASDNMYFADCSVTLTDNTTLEHTFNNGSEIYRRLITFSVGNTTAANLMQPATIEQIQNLPFTITASAETGIPRTQNFYSNLKPEVGEIDIGATVDGEAPIGSQEANSTLYIPVMFNSPNMALGVYGLELNFISMNSPKSPLELIEVVQGEDWRSGSIFFTEKNPNTVQFGGVLNSGAKGMIEIAVIKCRVLDVPGMAHLNVTHSYLSEASIFLNNISSVPDIFTASEVEFNITSTHDGKRRRRSSESSSIHLARYRRADTDSLDANDDGNVDLRDVFLLLEYIAAESANFETPAGRMVRNEIKNVNLSNVDITTISNAEKASLSLSFEGGVSVTLQPPTTADGVCQLVINVTVTPLRDRDVPQDNTVRVVLLLRSDEPTFQDEFDEYLLDELSLIERTVYGGLVGTNPSYPDGTAVINQATPGNFTTDFSLAVYLFVEVGVRIGDITLSAITSIDAEELFKMTFYNVSQTCSFPTIPPTPVVTPVETSTPVISSSTLTLTPTSSSTPLRISTPSIMSSATARVTPSMTTTESSITPSITLLVSSAETSSPVLTVRSVTPSVTPLFETSTMVLSSTISPTQSIPGVSSVTSSLISRISTTSLETSTQLPSTTPSQSATESQTSRLATPSVTPLVETSTPAASSATLSMGPSVTTVEATTLLITSVETATPSVTLVETTTPSITMVETATPSVTLVETATPSVTMVIPSVTLVETATPSITMVETATPSVTMVETATPSVTMVETATPSVTLEETATPSVTMVETATPSVTLEETATPSVTIVETTTPSVTMVETATPSVTMVETATPSVTMVETATPSVTLEETATPSVTIVETTTPSITMVETATPSVTMVETATPSVTLEETATPSVTVVTPSVTLVETATPSVTPVETATPSVTIVETTTLSVTMVETATLSVSMVTPSVTLVETATPSVTPVETATPSITMVETATPSVTMVETATPSVTPVETATPSVTMVETATPSVTMVETATSSVTMVETATPSVTTVEAGSSSVMSVETTTPSVTTTDVRATEATPGDVIIPVSVVMAIIIVILSLVVIGIVVGFVCKRRRKIGRYTPNVQRSTSRASDFWKEEMSIVSQFTIMAVMCTLHP